MNGPRSSYERYKEQMKKMEEPVMPSQVPKRKLNLKEIAKYMKDHNIDPKFLSDEVKENIILLTENKEY